MAMSSRLLYSHFVTSRALDKKGVYIKSWVFPCTDLTGFFLAAFEVFQVKNSAITLFYLILYK